MRILITGAYGQLGRELTLQGDAHTLLAVDRDQLDITDQDAVLRCVDDFRPDVVINAAAYTVVDKAEEEVELAFAVNRDGPANLALACEQQAIPLVHVSTDYVFDGTKAGAYIETDPANPLSVYGRSKLAGEEVVMQHCSRHLILRTSWVFSRHGNNFVKTMLRLGVERETLGVVADQCGKPTSASELARVILAVLPNMEDKWGTYHLAQPEVTSWYGFASAIFAEARAQGVALNVATLNAIESKDYPTPAKRPVNSELDCEKIRLNFGITILPWSKSLVKVIKELGDE